MRLFLDKEATNHQEAGTGKKSMPRPAELPRWERKECRDERTTPHKNSAGASEEKHF